MNNVRRTKLFLLLSAALGVSALAGCAMSGDSASADVTAPTISAVYPDDTAASVVINTAITAIFSESMDSGSIIAANFTVASGTTPVDGTITYNDSNKAAIFVPTNNLVINTLYTAKISTAVKDLAGNMLALDKVWTFTTGALSDTTAPIVNSMVPIDTTTNVAVNGTINATFNEAMNPSTIVADNFLVKAGGTTAVAGTVTYDLPTKTAIFTPTNNLAGSTEYTATILIGVKDVAGNALVENAVWSFTTGAALDTTPPAVISTYPLNAATGVAINGTVSAIFSEMMDPATFISANFTVATGGVSVAGAVTYDVQNWQAIFSPSANLAVSTTYTATITIAAKDLAGNALQANKVWTFTTSAAGLGPAPVILGTAGNFVILAKTAISTVPASVITGDIGLSPAAESFMTGFSQTKATGYSTSPQVTGLMYAADQTPPTPANMTTAIANMQTAYTDAAGRVTPDELNLSSGNLGGLTLSPGLYKWTSAVTVPLNVTISGGSNDVWIFQISGTLDVSAGKSVILSGEAKAKNIFWQVADTVVIGAGAHFEGIILGEKSITLSTNATMNGRALAQTLVALDQTTITKPAQ